MPAVLTKSANLPVVFVRLLPMWKVWSPSVSGFLSWAGADCSSTTQSAAAIVQRVFMIRLRRGRRRECHSIHRPSVGDVTHMQAYPSRAREEAGATTGIGKAIQV